MAFSWKLVFYLKLEELIKISFNEKAKLIKPVTRTISNDDQQWQHFIFFPGHAYKKKQTFLILVHALITDTHFFSPPCLEEENKE